MRCRALIVTGITCLPLMMVRWLALCSLLLLAACNPSPDATGVSLSTPSASPEPVSVWLETVDEGIRLGLWKPAGWAADTRDGLILAERVRPAPNSSTELPHGIVVNFFFPELSHFETGDDSSNHAVDVMEQALALPNVVAGTVGYTAPQGFDWRGHEAAYYLLCGRGDVRTLVIGVFLPDRHKLLVINVSMVNSQVDEVRASLPTLFAGFTVDGVEMGGAALDILPEPLEFPGADEPA